MRLVFAICLILFASLAALPNASEAASASELRYWRSIQDSRNPDDFERYLLKYPYGEFVPIAERKARNLRIVEDRKATERALGLDRSQRREVEARLSAAGFFPGSVNGTFNRDTRRAISKYRRSRGFTPHRFLDRRMLRQLVRDTERSYSSRQAPRSRSGVDDETAAGIVAGALLLGTIIILAD